MKNIRQIFLVFLISGIVMGLSACSASKNAQNPVSADASSLPAAPPIERLSAAAFVTGHSSDALIIDVRTPEEFSTGHLKEAININVQAGDFQEKIQMLDKDQTIYLYCRTGNRSGKAGEIMAAMGFKSLFNIGGFAELEQAGAATAGKATSEKADTNINDAGAGDRQAEVAAMGKEVMPFDLERSTHIFEKTETGGRQQVVSDDNNSEQIQLIQTHLAEEAAQFSKGDFHDPAMIHGHNMPGLHELMMARDRMTIVYSALNNGGQILFTSTDASTIKAIHKWFDAQVSDHGSHAQDHH